MASLVVFATLAGWAALLVASVLATNQRPRAGPPALTLGPEAPAVVDLLVHGWKPSSASAVGTLLDLAARGHVRIVTAPSGRLHCVGLGPVPLGLLTPFEQQVVELVSGWRHGDSQPAGALLPDRWDDDGKRWHSMFEAAVIDEARRSGVVRYRIPRGVFWALAAAGAVPAAALAGWLSDLPNLTHSEFDFWIRFGLFVLWAMTVVACVLLLAGLFRLSRGTDAGLAAARRWLGTRAALQMASRSLLPEVGSPVEDRMLAYAVVLDVAPELVSSVALAGATTAWSPFGGEWRQVIVPTAVKDAAPRRGRRGSEGAAQHQTVTGIVVRRWTRTVDHRHGSTDYYHLAVDDGHRNEAYVWRVSRGRYQRFAVGRPVRVTLDHRDRLVDIVGEVVPARRRT